ncbi:MAG TPA: MotA/TolQ/ExbB proton channel family protein [Chitinophagales bacterium]|nr:MotA/TolQ/ExbB proton channel family protein [Chitinophagales bacterium]
MTILNFILQVTTSVDSASAIQTVANTAPESISLFGLLTKGGIVMIPLLILSVIAIGFIVERIMYVNQHSKIDVNLVNNVLDKLYSGNVQNAEALCIQSNSALGNVLQAGITQLGKPIDHIEKALETQSNIELMEMERHTGYISLISGIAPRLGFVGTILGVIKIFYSISLSSDISIGTISGGLYEKMISSGTGLIIGIIAFMGYNFILTKIDGYSLKLQKAVFEFTKGIKKPTKL